MTGATTNVRATLARVAGRVGSAIASVRRSADPAPELRAPRKALLALSTVVAVSLASTGGTAALWTGSVTASVADLTAGSIVSQVTASTRLNHVYTSGELSKTTNVDLKNAGSVDAQYSVSFLTSSTSAMKDRITLTYWIATTNTCTAHATVPGTGWTGRFSAAPVATGSLAANTTVFLCVRTRLDTAALSTTDSFAPQVAMTLTVPGTSWSSTQSASGVHSVAADAAAWTDYTDVVKADGATRHWRLGEPSGRLIYDWIGTDDAYTPADVSVTRGAAGAIALDPNTATTFSGAVNGTAGTRASIAAPQSFAVEAWFNTTSADGGKIVGFGSASFGNSTSYDRHIYMDATGRLHFGAGSGTPVDLVSTAAYRDGTWHHVVGNLGPGGMQLYVDGGLVAQNTSVTSSAAYNGFWRIGGDQLEPGASNESKFFDGVIDEVAVYAAPLTAKQVTTHRNLSGRGAYPAGAGDAYGASVSDDNPTLYWRLGETGGAATALDSSGKGNTGAYSGSLTQGVSGAVPGTRNTATQFNGTNGLVASNTQFSNPQTYSLELWFKTTTTSGGKLIGFGSAQTGASGSADRHVYLRNDGRVTFGNQPDPAQLAVSAQSYNDGKWHHAVATQSSQGITLYIDGQNVASNSNAVAQNYSGYWRVGGDTLAGWPSAPTSSHVVAALDEVAVYPVALSSEKVKQRYAVATGTPIAVFTSTMSELAGTFDARSSRDLDGSIASYSWNWGDGSPAATGATPAKTYAAPGTYTVTLTVTDNAGLKSTVSTSVTAQDLTAPSVPGTPTVTANTGTTVALTWSASTDNAAVNVYEVFRDGVLIGTTSSSSYTSAGLTTDTAYSFSVRAVDTSGNRSGISPSTSVTTQPVDTAAWYEIRSAGNGHCIKASLPYADRPLGQGPCASPSTTDQAFRFTPMANGKLSLVLRAEATQAWSPAPTGASIYLSQYIGGTGQHWRPVKQSDGTYQIVSDSAKCLDYQNTSPGSTWTPAALACSATSSTQRVNLVAVP